MNPSANLILVGPMGAGKSSIGKRVADRLGLRFVDVDREIEDMTGATIPTIFECEGEAGFRQRERQALQAVLQTDGQVLATGGGAVLDPDNRALLRARGFVVYLHVDVPEQLQRLARDRGRPLLQRPDRAQVLHDMAQRRTPLYAEVADLRFDTGRHACGEASGALLHELASHWQREELPQ